MVQDSRDVNTHLVRELATECGLALAGIAAAEKPADFGRFRDWADRGLAGKMGYLADHRADLRSDPASLLPEVHSIICVALPYNAPDPYSTEFSDADRAWIARYAWSEDYHTVLRRKLEELATKLLINKEFKWRVCVDSAPLLERSLARSAGLGWIGRNTCLINQRLGSFFLLGELLTTLDLPPDELQPDRCGSCMACIEACPTRALVPSPSGGFELDSRLCISYFTIELHDGIPEPQRSLMGNNIFGCDICQDVCPWNRKAPRTAPAAFDFAAPPLDRFAEIDEAEFRRMFRGTPVLRAKYRGFVRNVAVAMGNSGLEKFRAPLEKMAGSEDALIAEHARWALGRLGSGTETFQQRAAACESSA